MKGLSCCPRCGDQGFERLKTYAHCVQCLYFEDYYSDIQKCAADAHKVEKEFEQKESSEESETNGEKAVA